MTSKPCWLQIIWNDMSYMSLRLKSEEIHWRVGVHYSLAS